MPESDLRYSGALDAAREVRAELRAALGDLERAVSAAIPAGDATWREMVAQATHRLRRTFADHLHATESDEGLFEEVLAEAPRLAPAVARLRAEHDEIENDLLALELALREPGAGERVRERAVQLLGRLVRHRQRGADLVYEAYETDIGGG